MLYEIGAYYDLSDFYPVADKYSNRVALTGTFFGNVKEYKNMLFSFEIKLNDESVITVYVDDKDSIPHSSSVLISGELCNLRKIRSAYRSEVDIFAKDVIELKSVNEVESIFQNTVYITGRVGTHPVKNCLTNTFDFMLMCRTSSGSFAELPCCVKTNKPINEFTKGTQLKLKGKIIQKPAGRRCGKQYIIDGVSNNIYASLI